MSLTEAEQGEGRDVGDEPERKERFGGLFQLRHEIDRDKLREKKA
jgi:hypothetical protein